VTWAGHASGLYEANGMVILEVTMAMGLMNFADVPKYVFGMVWM
jgi:hypothetical protein